MKLSLLISYNTEHFIAIALYSFTMQNVVLGVDTGCRDSVVCARSVN